LGDVGRVEGADQAGAARGDLVHQWGSARRALDDDGFVDVMGSVDEDQDDAGRGIEGAASQSPGGDRLEQAGAIPPVAVQRGSRRREASSLALT
jgi:hypothetical protein